MGLPDKRCSLDGLFFKVLLNGQNRFEHFAFNTPGWVDAQLTLSEFAGETVLLELVTDSVESATCDWAHWAKFANCYRRLKNGLMQTPYHKCQFGV